MSENFTNNEESVVFSAGPVTDIDELQAIIKQKMADDEANSPDYLENFESSENFAVEISSGNTNEEEEKPSLDDEYYDIAPKEKKYVVEIGPDSVPFFEQLLPEKRNEIINNLLVKYVADQKKDPEIEKTKRFFKHSLVVVFTIIIGFPLLFYLINASIEATTNSYRAVQNSFEKLYQQKGGIKRKDLTKIQNLQY